MRKLMLILAIVLSFMLTACGHSAKGGASEQPPERPREADPAIAALSSTIGNTDTIRQSGMLPRDKGLEAAGDYGPRTGKWFEGDGGFNLIASFSAGEQEAGSTVGAALNEVPKDRSVRFQLTSRDEAGKRKELIEEYTAAEGDPVYGRADFTAKLPTEANVNYLLSIEILTADGKVEDTFLTPLYVPYHELNVKLTVDAPAKGSGETLLRLYNAGPASLFFGYGYSIYRLEKEGWTIVPDDERAVDAIGIQLDPGKTFEEKVFLPNSLSPGKYRIAKSFDGYETDLSTRLAADFEIR
ncbi:hypothetical protein KP806_24455 [Paenibacillus sp. N4]|uniref:immunoglobulin-like domain-containing protein n=1 Tax=Paenibacillus vietnamensis TaxID=2590547 RepID=UPI001CD13A8B|nr:immunoglobulin-like domain-containing protein [Paenibacillus vietnamensis]MCA0758212.1 hypothetical protein [Paenibacillus vietnamensis]